ncbi:putative Small-subunit processome [Seiridium cardinale]
MSSLRNAVNRRVHRERAQPKERQRFGLLEKSKASQSPPAPAAPLLSARSPTACADRKLREQDHNRKKRTLKALRAKAAERNEDEFFFGMLSRQGPQGVLSKGKRWNGTVDGDRGNRALSVDEVRLLKTQDMGYLRTVRNTSAKEVKMLEERVIGLGGSLEAKVVDDADMSDEDDDWLDEGPAKKKPKKIVFTDGLEEREERLADEAADEEEEDEEEADQKIEGKADAGKSRAEQRERLLLKLQRRLATARKRLKAVSTAENELEMQRAKMAKTQTVGGVTKSGKKFKVRERKR